MSAVKTISEITLIPANQPLKHFKRGKKARFKIHHTDESLDAAIIHDDFPPIGKDLQPDNITPHVIASRKELLTRMLATKGEVSHDLEKTWLIDRGPFSEMEIEEIIEKLSKMQTYR